MFSFFRVFVVLALCLCCRLSLVLRIVRSCLTFAGSIFKLKYRFCLTFAGSIYQYITAFSMFNRTRNTLMVRFVLFCPVLPSVVFVLSCLVVLSWCCLVLSCLVYSCLVLSLSSLSLSGLCLAFALPCLALSCFCHPDLDFHIPSHLAQLFLR